MSATMRAVVVDAPGPADVLRVREIPKPVAEAGEVVIDVRAFGLNRSELHFRSGLADFGSFPRVPGLEAVGVVASAPGGEFAEGAQVATLMGGMGRLFDGGYAEQVVVPAGQVIPFHSDLPWEVLGAVPEMLQTANGSLEVGVRAASGQSILVRGATSGVGRMIVVLARRAGLTVLATTRRPAAREELERVGAHHVIIDTGEIAREVRALVPGGPDCAVELVGVGTLRDTLRAVRAGGSVCFTGMLSDEWTIRDFYPMDWLPNGTRLTAYSGEASDLSADVLQGFLDSVAAGEITVPLGRVYRMDDIVTAHRDMEVGAIGGKGVVLP